MSKGFADAANSAKKMSTQLETPHQGVWVARPKTAKEVHENAFSDDDRCSLMFVLEDGQYDGSGEAGFWINYTVGGDNDESVSLGFDRLRTDLETMGCDWEKHFKKEMSDEEAIEKLNELLAQIADKSPLIEVNVKLKTKKGKDGEERTYANGRLKKLKEEEVDTW